MTTYIIAEMAWAHDGSMEKAIKILSAAKEAGANAISIHITDMESYMVPHYGNGTGKVSAGREHLDIYKYLEDINLSHDDWGKFAIEAKKLNMDVCVMPNDAASLEFSEREIKPKYYVISAASFVEPDFVVAIAKCSRPTLFRIGGATLGEIEINVNLFRQHSSAKIVLLHGFQNYPTLLEETNIYQLVALKETFDVVVGLSDHLDGGDIDAQFIPLLAIPLGGTYIEKHITLDRDEKGEDFESSLNPGDFKQFVKFVRKVEIALGKQYWQPLSDATMRYRDISRKKIVAACSIEKGKVIVKEDIVCKRSDVGLTPDKLQYVIGRRATKSIQKDNSILMKDLS